MRIRDLEPKDIERVLRYRTEGTRISFPGERIDKEFIREKLLKAAEGGCDKIRVALDEGKPVGYIWLSNRRTSTGTIGVVNHVFIEKGYRERGLATELMRQAEGIFKSGGIRRIRATVTLANRPSIMLCRKLGYRERRTVLEKEI